MASKNTRYSSRSIDRWITCCAYGGTNQSYLQVAHMPAGLWPARFSADHFSFFRQQYRRDVRSCSSCPLHSRHVRLVRWAAPTAAITCRCCPPLLPFRDAPRLHFDLHNVQLGKLGWVASKLATKQTLRLASQELDRAGGVTGLACRAGEGALWTAKHPVEAAMATVAMAADAASAAYEQAVWVGDLLATVGEEVFSGPAEAEDGCR